MNDVLILIIVDGNNVDDEIQFKERMIALIACVSIDCVVVCVFATAQFD